jgi:hypothetical protein
MSMGLMFWVLMLLWLVFSLASAFGGGAIGQYGPAVNSVLLFILFVLLGWKVFGLLFRSASEAMQGEASAGCPGRL